MQGNTTIQLPPFAIAFVLQSDGHPPPSVGNILERSLLWLLKDCGSQEIHHDLLEAQTPTGAQSHGTG